METEDSPEHNHDFQDTYHDDSDVEARLYAEVYYSNTIIGEENNTNNSTSERQCPDSSKDSNKGCSNNHELLQGKNTIQQKSNRSIAQSNGSTNCVFANAGDTTGEFNALIIKESISTHKINDLSNKSKKRKTNNCLDDANRSSKRKKNENQFHGLSSGPKPSQQKNNIVQCDDSSLINPYNKDALANGQKGIKLLSPEFINLFFPGKSSRQKKKTNYPIKQNRNKKNTSTSNISSNINSMQKSLNIRSAESNLHDDCSTKSDVIDISSDSNESFDNGSKYKTIVATDKKLKERETGLKHSDTSDASDSEESIFEVPVPPKPAPPVIEVNDSDNESKNQYESDDDSFLNDSLISQEALILNNHEITLDSTVNQTQDICDITSDNDDSNGLILNCTEVQRGASSLDEIKRMHQQTSSPIQRNSSTSISTNTQHSQNKSESCNNPVVNEKSPTSLQKNKQKSKSSSRNISEVEYFFRPMNEKMKSFYNDSWGGENFDIDKIKSNMSTDPSKWAILNKDLAITGPRKKRYFGMTCARCQKQGHRQIDCPEPSKGPTCHMCGINGHVATYCPHSKCLTCGRYQTTYRTTCESCQNLFCTRCRSQGHKDDSCPDLWRRYHHTTNSYAPKVPRNIQSTMKSRHELICCNCTRQGHDSSACRKLRWLKHFNNPSFVTHYNGPIYSTDNNFNASPMVHDVQESPYHIYNGYDYSSNCDNLFSDSMVSNTIPTNFPRSDRNNENRKIIFNISGINHKLQKEIATKDIVTLKLNVPDKSNPDSAEKWKKLSEFLKSLTHDIPAEFCLERKEKQFLFHMKCSRELVKCLSPIINEYTSRSIFERSQMFLSCGRNIKLVLDNLSRKFAEMKNLNEDILVLHEEIKQLRKDLLDENGQIQNLIHDRPKLDELSLLQEKLLMLLYREGFGDNSLGKLRKLFTKIQKSMNKSPDKCKSKKRYKYGSAPLLPTKKLLTYLYNYNNVFVPHYSKKLESYIRKYKNNLDKRNKLLSCSLLFPQPTDKKQSDCNQMTIPNSVVDEKALSENSSKVPTSTSDEQSILQNIVMEAPVNTINDNTNSLNLASSTQTLALPNKKTEKPVNILYSQAITATDQNQKLKHMQIFRNFIKNARNCLEKASKLNSPRLCNDIVNLRRELEDEIHLNVLTVTKFRKKVRAEVLRLRRAPSVKKIKKHKVKTNADDIYKKFCASL